MNMRSSAISPRIVSRSPHVRFRVGDRNRTGTTSCVGTACRGDARGGRLGGAARAIGNRQSCGAEQRECSKLLRRHQSGICTCSKRDQEQRLRLRIGADFGYQPPLQHTSELFVSVLKSGNTMHLVAVLPFRWSGVCHALLSAGRSIPIASLRMRRADGGQAEGDRKDDYCGEACTFAAARAHN
jgi:hypothetical protein